MISINLDDAMQECADTPSCHMFYDVCGCGIEFKLCKSKSTQAISECGAVLYIKDGQGSLNVIKFS